MIIASGQAKNVITRVAAGESVGTRFPALESPLENRKRWIYAGRKPAGLVTVDAGAVNALCENGRSLLPAGIVSVTGHFGRGDTVTIEDQNGHELARGIVRYASDDLQQIAGYHSDKIAEILGFAYGPVVVHRNDMILH